MKKEEQVKESSLELAYKGIRAAQKNNKNIYRCHTELTAKEVHKLESMRFGVIVKKTKEGKNLYDIVWGPKNQKEQDQYVETQKAFQINFKKVKTVKDVISILKSMELEVSWFQDECPPRFKEINDLGILIPIKR